MTKIDIAADAMAPETITAITKLRAKARKAALKAKAKPASKAEGKAFLAKGKAEVQKQQKAAKPAKAKPAAEPAAKAKPAASAITIKGEGLQPVDMRAGSKQAAMYQALTSKAGATGDELQKATGFTRSTMMSAIHGGRIKRFLKAMGGKLTTTEDEKRGKVYRIVAK